MSEQNKAVVRRFLKAFADNDQTILREVLAPDYTFHHHALGSVDREKHLQGIQMFAAAFSDVHITVEDQVAEGDRVATRITWQAIHSGVFQGHPPTNKRFQVSGITIERIKAGKIVERWFSQDRLGMMQQLGLAPQPGAES